ncbi:alkaline phosphatase family protein [Colletotrichum tofieldiae]|nr:alkaline phosphatase family protein [Colletotrichum tofieldiae]
MSKLLSAEDKAALLAVEQRRRPDSARRRGADDHSSYSAVCNAPSPPNPDADGILDNAALSSDNGSLTVLGTEGEIREGERNTGSSWTGQDVIDSSSPQKEAPSITVPLNLTQDSASLPEVNRVYTAPFSLGQAILEDVSPLPELDLPISKPEQSRLMIAYLRDTGTWCETTDSDKHFTVKSIHHMMGSKAFVAAALSLSSRQQDTIRGRQGQTALELYQHTIRLLIHQDPSEADASVLAACTLLCVYEMMASDVSEWRRHLKVRAAFPAVFGVGYSLLLPGMCWAVEKSSMGRF